MKTLCEYRFINNKRIAIELLNAKDIKKNKVNKADNFMLVFESGKGKRFNRTAFGLRADEMLQIITLIGYALYVGISGFNINYLRGYNGFDFK